MLLPMLFENVKYRQANSISGVAEVVDLFEGYIVELITNHQSLT